ncbi:MAG: hypothetical protein DDG59_13195 [Anaerolineae bacterium]|jgi:hypothetical protein|nr:MAG: hypothetical protein DDG59_13195 [Anaerolineae bacterium]
MAESLLNTILANDPTRQAMAIEVLTRWLQDSRSLLRLSILLQSSSDPYSLTLVARGLGWLANPDAIPLLAGLLGLNFSVMRSESVFACGKRWTRTSTLRTNGAQAFLLAGNDD